jgi:hypothetical protein
MTLRVLKEIVINLNTVLTSTFQYVLNGNSSVMAAYKVVDLVVGVQFSPIALSNYKMLKDGDE